MGYAMQQMGGALILKKKLDAAIGPHLVVVKGATAGSVALPGGADVNFMGVTTEDGAINEYRDVVVGGPCIVKCTASAAIAEGALVSVAGATGKIKTAAPAAGSNSFIVGKAMEAAAADGDLIGVLFMPCVLQG
jgi:hypothetical protein